MTISPGDLWIADIPFTDGSGSKKRPVLVLWLDGADAVVAAVTTAPARTVADLPLSDWKPSGLKAPSTVRLARLDCLEQSLLLRKLGRLSARNALEAHVVWKEHIKPAF
jgi:mRNA-degrading endonuclease toxin of MazEF toxin-antitoxin module